MRSLPALFMLMVGILLAGMVQVARSVAVLTSPVANTTVPSFSGIDRTMRNLHPAWWAMGALVIVAVIAWIAMSNRDRSGNPVIRG